MIYENHSSNKEKSIFLAFSRFFDFYPLWDDTSSALRYLTPKLGKLLTNEAKAQML